MAARRTITSTFAVLLVGLSMLAGCTPADPAGQPTYSCTPDDGSSPYACYKVQYDAKAKEAALYTEAEKVYRKFFAEEERIYRTGGVTEPTPVLLEATTGSYLESSMTIYRDLAARHSKVQSGEFRIAWIRRAPDDSEGGATVTLKSCSDASRVLIGPSPAQAKPGLIVEETAFFTGALASLRLSSSRTKVVSQC